MAHRNDVPGHPLHAGLGGRNRGTRTAAQPQQKHKCQAETRPKNVQDNIVDICSPITPPCARKVLNEFDAE